MRLGIFGGSFDPPHTGHLLAAVDALEELELDRIVLVPAGVQPLKAESISAPAKDRLEMVRLLAGDDPRFEVDTTELDRPGLSFMVDTLSHLTERHSGAQLFLLVGADVLDSFHKWKEPQRILTLATLAVMRRVREGGQNAEDAPAIPAAKLGHFPRDRELGSEERYRRDATELVRRWGSVELKTRRVDISSTEIRQRVADALSIRGFVPEAIERYIASRGLYRQKD